MKFRENLPYILLASRNVLGKSRPENTSQTTKRRSNALQHLYSKDLGGVTEQFDGIQC
jgi:hypothetical protein